MLILKTNTYSFLKTEKESKDFIKYMQEKYEWGGAMVYVYETDGFFRVELTTVLDTIEDRDFQTYCLKEER